MTDRHVLEAQGLRILQDVTPTRAWRASAVRAKKSHLQLQLRFAFESKKEKAWNVSTSRGPVTSNAGIVKMQNCDDTQYKTDI